MCQMQKIAESFDGYVEWCAECRAIGICFGNFILTRLSEKQFRETVAFFSSLQPESLSCRKGDKHRRYVSVSRQNVYIGFTPEEFILLEIMLQSAQERLDLLCPDEKEIQTR